LKEGEEWNATPPATVYRIPRSTTTSHVSTVWRRGRGLALIWTQVSSSRQQQFTGDSRAREGERWNITPPWQAVNVVLAYETGELEWCERVCCREAIMVAQEAAEASPKAAEAGLPLDEMERRG
jgi:hypothetical protein